MRASCLMMRTAAAILAGAILVAVMPGCARTEPTPKVEPITIEEVRARFAGDPTRVALSALKEESIREIASRYADERQRDARTRRRTYVIEKVLQGEDVNIGNGLRMVRLFALGHEHDAERFWTYLEAIEIVGTRLHQALRTQVGSSDKRLATLEFLDLDRAALRTYEFAAKDAPCCPTRIVDTIFAWRGITLEEMR
ncbi:MAG: hypothetical protein ACKVQU_14685 [Burkholderiales bacterium]